MLHDPDLPNIHALIKIVIMAVTEDLVAVHFFQCTLTLKGWADVSDVVDGDLFTPVAAKPVISRRHNYPCYVYLIRSRTMCNDANRTQNVVPYSL